jgi:hypothetical protein
MQQLTGKKNRVFKRSVFDTRGSRHAAQLRNGQTRVLGARFFDCYPDASRALVNSEQYSAWHLR